MLLKSRQMVLLYPEHTSRTNNTQQMCKIFPKYINKKNPGREDISSLNCVTMKRDRFQHSQGVDCEHALKYSPHSGYSKEFLDTLHLISKSPETKICFIMQSARESWEASMDIYILA